MHMSVKIRFMIDLWSSNNVRCGGCPLIRACHPLRTLTRDERDRSKSIFKPPCNSLSCSAQSVATDMSFFFH